MESEALPEELKHLVRDIFDLWGGVIREEAGPQCYAQVEQVRRYIKKFRTRNTLTQEILAIKRLEGSFQQLDQSELEDITHSFSVLLELINLCENAFRSVRIREQRQFAVPVKEHKQEIYLVLTAHPTESRAPEAVDVLQRVQAIILRSLVEKDADILYLIRPWLKQLWHLRMARQTKPEVRDEADYIYSLIFRDEIIQVLLEPGYKNVFIRSWVGGDKDGHPGVNEKTLLQSLQLSRTRLLRLLKQTSSQIHDQLDNLEKLQRKGSKLSTTRAATNLASLIQEIKLVEKIRRGDGKRIKALRKKYDDWTKRLNHDLRETLVGWQTLSAIWEKFPALVVPLELRESAEVFAEPVSKRPAILRMLFELEKISSPIDPRNYARGLIISMAKTKTDLENARNFVVHAFGKKQIFPVIPLFEQAEALEQGPQVVRAWIKQENLKSMEVMLGYSDSSKESGVLPSRYLIANSLFEFEKLVVENPGLRLTYFHGSGGSEARGGGPLELQTAHWPKTAFERFKVTLQGEMIQRTFSTPEILTQYLNKIQSLSQVKKLPYQLAKNETAKKFISLISENYKQTLQESSFLEMVEKASAYKYLELMQIGSRPVKRKKLAGVSSLRAIPWILAWTQTRVLLPTWWGVGSAFKNLTPDEIAELRELVSQHEPVLTTYLQQLGFTLAKIEPEVWFLYLERSSLSQTQKKDFYKQFLNEYQKTVKAFQALTGQDEFLWFKPWLSESIRLRSPLIHPLNVAQVIAWDKKNTALVRESAVGIACGMLTTG